MKKYLLPLLLIASVSQAEFEQIGPFGSLNNTDPSYVIPSNMAQDLLNVDTSDQLKSIKKRRGYGTAFTLTNSTSPVHGVYYFYDTDGSDVALAFNDRNVNRSVSGASMSAIYTSATNGATWQCTDSNGFAYCANTSRDGIFKIDASAISTLSGFTSTGTMVTVTQERLVQAGFSADPNVVLFSKANDFTTWTLGGGATDPIQFTITSPGSGVKHITYAHGRVYWFKDASFGYILEGQTQSEWQVVTISAFLGNINNTSIYRDEILYFQGNDSHFYAYDGSNLVKLSKDIQATISLTQGRATNSWSQSTQSDWGDGISVPAQHISSNIVSGQIMGSSFTVTETTNADFNQGTSSNVMVSNNSLILSTGPANVADYSFEFSSWSTVTNFNQVTLPLLAPCLVARTGTRVALSSGVTGSDPQLGAHVVDGITGEILFSGSTITWVNDDCTYSTRTIPSNSTYIRRYVKIKFIQSVNGSSITSVGFIYNGDPITYYTASDALGPITYRAFAIDDVTNGASSISSGTYISKSYDTVVSTNLVSLSSVAISINGYTPEFTLQTSHDNSVWRQIGTSVTSTSTFKSNRYLRYIATFTVSGSSNALTTLNSTTLVARATGTYYSNVHNSPSIGSWDTFGATYNDDGGSIVFQIRASTNVFNVSSSTPSWTVITPGSIPSISTGTYFQMSSSFSVTAATQNPTISDFTFNWFEGGATDKTYATYFDNANWWAVASGVGATTNNKILKFNLINPGWYIYDIPMNGMYVKNESLYFGGVSAGKVFKFGDVDNDDGTAIEAYWKSKDFFGANPFLEKNYTRMSTVHPAVANSTMTVTYTINGSSVTSYDVPLTWGSQNFTTRNVNLPQGKNGKTINFQFGNDAADQPFELFGGQLEYTIKPWVPTGSQ